MEQNIYNAIYKVNHAGGCGSCFYLKQYDLFVTNYHVHHYVGQKVHLYGLVSISATSLASSALHIKRETARLIATNLSFGRRCCRNIHGSRLDG